jgi:hypothetical protein
MRIACENCGAIIHTEREPVVQETRPADQVGPAVHVIIGNGWVVHRCIPAHDSDAGYADDTGGIADLD